MTRKECEKLDNEKKMNDDDMSLVDDTSESEQTEDDSAAEVVIENFDEEKDEDMARYEQYIRLMNEEGEDDEDVAAVAERITGERHSRVSTAAPIRVRDSSAQSRPQTPPTSVGHMRDTAAVPRVHDSAGEREPRRKEQGKTENAAPSGNGGNVRRYALVSAAVLLLILISAAAVMTGVLHSREDSIPVEAPPSENEELPIEPSEENSETTSGDTSEEAEVSGDGTADTSGDTSKDATEPEVETEPETEPEPEPEPEFTITLDFYDREDIVTTVPAMTLSELYAAVGYTPRESDRPSVGLDDMIAADAYITIDTVEYKNVSVTEVLPYESDIIELDTIPRGEVNYLSYGENGEIVRTYTVEYINDAEVSRTLAWEETTKAPVNETYELGVGGSFVGEDGVTYTYSYKRTVPSTYYNIEGLTYLGTMADETVIAVDPEKIPLGTRVYVKNDVYDFGVRIASDVGPKIEEWEVDVWLSPNDPQYASFAQVGYHYDMEIYYID